MFLGILCGGLWVTIKTLIVPEKWFNYQNLYLYAVPLLCCLFPHIQRDLKILGNSSVTCGELGQWIKVMIPMKALVLGKKIRVSWSSLVIKEPSSIVIIAEMIVADQTRTLRSWDIHKTRWRGHWILLKMQFGISGYASEPSSVFFIVACFYLFIYFMLYCS